MKRAPKSLIYFFLITMAFYSCSDSKALYDSIDTAEITLTKQMEIDGGDDLMIGNINQVEITGNREMLLLDTQQKKIHLFDSAGNFIGSELSEGEGPGEVRQVGRMDYSNDLVQVYDWSQRKLSRYRVESDIENGNVQLSFVEDLLPEYYPIDFHITPDGTGYVLIYPGPGDEENKIIISAMKEEVLPEDSLLSFPNDEIIEVKNPDGQMLATFSSPHDRQIIPIFYENKLVLGRSEQVGFEIYNLMTGELIDSVSYNRPDIDLTSVEKRQFLEDMTERMGMGGTDMPSLISQMPDQKGKVRNLFYDPDGVIWLNLIGDDKDANVPEWLLLNDEGELLGKVSEEFDGAVMAVTSGKVYVRESTEEGEQFLSVYNYELPQ